MTQHIDLTNCSLPLAVACHVEGRLCNLAGGLVSFLVNSEINAAYVAQTAGNLGWEADLKCRDGVYVVSAFREQVAKH